MNTASWIVAVLLIITGVAGTILPALPGAPLVFAGVLLAAWIDDFARVSGWTVAVVGVLALAALAADFLAGIVGAKRVGASRLAVLGAAIGTLAGVFTGLVGLLFMPLAGAAIGQFLTDRDALRAGRVGVATWIGLLVGTIAKVAIVFVMVGAFLAALLID